MLEATADDFIGRVEGVFAGGFYVSGPSQAIFAVLGPGAWPGPLHLVAEALPALPALHDPVSVSAAVLAAGRLRVSVQECRRWAPRLPERLRVGRADWQSIAPSVEPDLVAVWGSVAQGMRRGDMDAVLRLLEGRGAGLTPSGDDVLAGILLVCAIDPRRRPTLDVLARSVRSTPLSRAFLRWAAAGQSIQPAHTLLDAAAACDRAGMRRAARSLAAVGATSGEALMAGVALAATELTPTMALRPTVA